MAIVRYHYNGPDNSPYSYQVNLYTRLNQQEYLDKISCNYKDKFPLIFGKWDLLKNNLQSILLYAFDFTFYGNSNFNTFQSSLFSSWFPGNKEFYQDFMIMMENSRENLSKFHSQGNYIFTKLIGNTENDKEKIFEDKNVAKILFKLNALCDMLSLADVKDFLRNLKSNRPIPKLDLPELEKLFGNAFSFLFYLNLNLTEQILSRKDSDSFDQKIPSVLVEQSYLGSPKLRLIYVLGEDTKLKEWFTEIISNIMKYRTTSLKRMKKVYDELKASSRSYYYDEIKKVPNILFDKQEMARITPRAQEFNASRIMF